MTFKMFKESWPKVSMAGVMTVLHDCSCFISNTPIPHVHLCQVVTTAYHNSMTLLYNCRHACVL